MIRQYKKILALNSAFIDDYFSDFSEKDKIEIINDVDNVIKIHGTIEARENFFTSIGLGVSNEFIQNKLVELYDAGAKEIILDIDSAGGSVEGTIETAALVRLIAAEIPVTAYVRDMAGSAAYWIASQATTIKASPTASVGSIGVIATYYDDSEALSASGVRKISVVSDSSPNKVLSDGFLDAVKNEVNAVSDLFIADVAKGRKVDELTVREKFGAGAMFNASQALNVGMIDEIILKIHEVKKMSEEKNQIAPDPMETIKVSEAPAILNLCESIDEVKKIAIPLIEKNASSGDAALALLEFRKNAVTNYEKEKSMVPDVASEPAPEVSEIDQIRKNAELLAGIKG